MQAALKQHHDVHLARKIWHFLGVVSIAICYHNLERPEAILWLAIFGTLGILLDAGRLFNPGVNNWVMKVLGPLMRDHEKNRLSGTAYLLVGVFVIVVFFDPLIVKLSLLFLALADPVASYFGIRYGRDKIFGRKSFQGSFAAFVTCLLISLGYFYSKDLMLDRLFMVSILAGLAGAIAEAAPVGRLDDNLVLPVLSSTLLYGIFYLFGGFPVA
jgi:diacylglycerol kinase (CTP)